MRLFALVLLVLCMDARAHRQHFAWTRVTLDSDGGLLMLEHRVHEHDAAEWLRGQSANPVDITNLKAQARFAMSVQQRFVIYRGSKPLTRVLLGAELDGPYLFVFEEVQLDSPGAIDFGSFEFESSLLMDLYDDQTHIVDAEVGSTHSTISLKRGRPRAALSISGG